MSGWKNFWKGEASEREEKWIIFILYRHGLEGKGGISGETADFIQIMFWEGLEIPAFAYIHENVQLIKGISTSLSIHLSCSIVLFCKYLKRNYLTMF